MIPRLYKNCYALRLLDLYVLVVFDYYYFFGLFEFYQKELYAYANKKKSSDLILTRTKYIYTWIYLFLFFRASLFVRICYYEHCIQWYYCLFQIHTITITSKSFLLYFKKKILIKIIIIIIIIIPIRIIYYWKEKKLRKTECLQVTHTYIYSKKKIKFVKHGNLIHCTKWIEPMGFVLFFFSVCILV